MSSTFTLLIVYILFFFKKIIKSVLLNYHQRIMKKCISFHRIFISKLFYILHSKVFFVRCYAEMQDKLSTKITSDTMALVEL